MGNDLWRRAIGAFGALAASAAFLAADAAAQTLSTGTDATATLDAGVRYRTLSGSGPGGGAEVYVFPSPCCVTTTNGQGTWAASNAVSITYSPVTGNISTTAAGTTTTRNVGDLGDLNYIAINIVKNGSPGTALALNSIALNGGSSLGNAALSGSATAGSWNISGATLASGFTVAGTMALTGLSGGGDSNYVQIEVGYVAPSDNMGPVTSDVTIDPSPALLNQTVTVSAKVDDTTKGGSTIASAQYSLNNGAWTAMTASDGAFDEVAEDVEADFTAATLGVNEVCVKGTDAAGNTGDAACQTFRVNYKFTGFFSPIDNTLLNTVKAGQAIPAKWRLTDANDVPISDPASFSYLASYPIDCGTLTGNIEDAIEEIASGASGLQYNGDGYWQFNWKTPKTYADTCRAMYVEFNGGQLSPTPTFKFRK